ncbi:putative No apical meristem-associated domain-containing protein [Helianthus annuus]|nr:putative No apical meristem-associated domain-containing protein [Helianthus annuus]
MIDEFMLYEDLRIGPKFFISNRAKNFFVIFGDGPATFSHFFIKKNPLSLPLSSIFYKDTHFLLLFYTIMHPFRPPFGVPARPTNPNTTQPQNPYNLQDMDPNFLPYAAYLTGATPFVAPTFGYGQAGGSQPSQPQPESEPDVDVVSETQPEPVQDKSKRGRRSHKKKDKDEPRRTKTIIKWTKEEEFTLTRAWLDVSEDEETVYQRNYDTRPSGESDIGVLTRTLEEFERTKCPFTYYKCWELLRKSPKWAVVNPMTSSSRRRAKRSKTSSSVDPSTPTSDARNVDLNEAVDVDEGIQEELIRPTGRRKGTGKKTVESSSDLELKEDFEEMNRHIQDIRDLGHQCYEIMKERVVETKKFNEMQEARQMEKDIEFLSKPIDHLQGDALILAQMRRQKIREKYGL